MTAVAGAVPAAVTDVQSRVVLLQQRIAALSGRTLAGASATAPTSATFSSTLALAQAQLDGAASSTGAGATSGDDLVASATRYLGVPYRWGGTDPDTGLDCSGLVQRVLADNGISAPRTAAQQATIGTEVPSLAQAQPGDLVVLDGGHHIGIYVGDGRMLHAPKSGDVVKVSKVWETPMTIRRVTGGTDGSGSTGATASSASSLAALRAAALGTSSTTRSGAGAYQRLFDAAEARYGLPDGLLSAVAAVESGYDADAVSPVGARGLMQLMPGTAADLGVDATDPAQAVDGAARLLSSHLGRFGSLPLALAAYNAGPGNVAKYDGVPPFSETQQYVRKVTAALAEKSS